MSLFPELASCASNSPLLFLPYPLGCAQTPIPELPVTLGINQSSAWHSSCRESCRWALQLSLHGAATLPWPWQGSFVAAFASSNLGDVSPNTRGPFCANTGESCDNPQSSCPVGGVSVTHLFALSWMPLPGINRALFLAHLIFWSFTPNLT